jgi:hypothetical protein
VLVYLAFAHTEHTLQTKIQEKYQLHRTTRNAQQKAKMLDKNFQGVNIDPILLRLQDPTVEPGFKDPRNCLVGNPVCEPHVKQPLIPYTTRSFGVVRQSRSKI